MFKDTSYKLSFIYAAVVHILLLMFLVFKYHSNINQFAMQNSNIVNAVAVNMKNFDKQVSHKQTQEVVREVVSKEQTKIEEQSKIEPREQVVPEPKTVPKEVPQVDQAKIKAQKKSEELRKSQELLRKRMLLEELKESKMLKEKIQKEKQAESAKAAAEKQAKSAKSAKVAAERQQMMEQMLQNQLAGERQELVAAHGQQISGEVNKYKAVLIQAISAQWIVPDGVAHGTTCVLMVEIAPGGLVLSAKIIKPSGNELLDRSAQKAVMKASPLPVPEDPTLFDEFRLVKLTVRPEGIV